MTIQSEHEESEGTPVLTEESGEAKPTFLETLQQEVWADFERMNPQNPPRLRTPDSLKAKETPKPVAAAAHLTLDEKTVPEHFRIYRELRELRGQVEVLEAKLMAWHSDESSSQESVEPDAENAAELESVIGEYKAVLHQMLVLDSRIPWGREDQIDEILAIVQDARKIPWFTAPLLLLAGLLGCLLMLPVSFAIHADWVLWIPALTILLGGAAGVHEWFAGRQNSELASKLNHYEVDASAACDDDQAKSAAFVAEYCELSEAQQLTLLKTDLPVESRNRVHVALAKNPFTTAEMLAGVHSVESSVLTRWFLSRNHNVPEENLVALSRSRNPVIAKAAGKTLAEKQQLATRLHQIFTDDSLTNTTTPYERKQ